MSRKTLDSRSSIDSCAFQLNSWRPFYSASKTLDSSDSHYHRPYSSNSSNGFLSKRPCFSDRATSFSLDTAAIDLSRLSLVDDDSNKSVSLCGRGKTRSSWRLIARKRRRKGSRSVSGRSSDRSGTRRCCSVGASAAYGTCSDFPVAVGTDSSGELFGNGGDSMHWGSDVSEAKNSRKDKDGGGSGDKETLGVGVGVGQFGGFDVFGNESGYGSEPGYRGDAEYGDEVDEEEEDGKVLFWGDEFGGVDTKMEIVGEKTFSDQKVHHRGRRKKHDYRMVDTLR